MKNKINLESVIINYKYENGIGSKEINLKELQKYINKLEKKIRMQKILIERLTYYLNIIDVPIIILDPKTKEYTLNNMSKQELYRILHEARRQIYLSEIQKDIEALNEEK